MKTNELAEQQVKLRNTIKLILASTRYGVELEDKEYLHMDNGKRFYKFSTWGTRLFMSIREDGDTRTVYNGFVGNIRSFTIINQLVW